MRNYIGPSTEGDDEWSNSRSLESYGLDFIALEPRYIFLRHNDAPFLTPSLQNAEDFENLQHFVITDFP